MYFPASKIYKMGACFNIDETLSKYRITDCYVKVKTLIYHNKAFGDRFDFEKSMFSKFVKYHVRNK